MPGIKERNPDGIFLAACLWHEKNPAPWSPCLSGRRRTQRHHRRELQFGLAWIAEFLEGVTAAAIIGLQELNRLLEAEKKGRTLGATARSRLPQAVDAVLRSHIVTAGGLARSIRVTPQGALSLLRQLTENGIIQEVTGRAS